MTCVPLDAEGDDEENGGAAADEGVVEPEDE